MTTPTPEELVELADKIEAKAVAASNSLATLGVSSRSQFATEILAAFGVAATLRSRASQENSRG